MKIVAYLNFDGECEAAFKFYERLLGAKLEALMSFGSTPAAEGVPPSHRDKIMHARLVLGPGQELMGSDSPPGRHQTPKGMHVSLMVDSIAEGDASSAGLADGGTVEMPFEHVLWAPLRHGRRPLRHALDGELRGRPRAPAPRRRARGRSRGAGVGRASCSRTRPCGRARRGSRCAGS